MAGTKFAVRAGFRIQASRVALAPGVLGHGSNKDKYGSFLWFFLTMAANSAPDRFASMSILGRIHPVIFQHFLQLLVP